jgi:hypothetical protein
MIKKLIFNFILILVFFVWPWYFLYQNQNSTLEMKSIEIPALLVIFFGAILLIYLNRKYRKQSLCNKWIWVVFQMIGIVGLCYSGFILWLLYSFRHGIGF